jgi:tetratricopeptide (TPR) repeat protein
MSRRRKRTASRDARPRIDLPRLLGEIAIIAVILVVPLVINRRSSNLCDVKDIALVVGATWGLALWLVTSLIRGRLTWVRSRLNLTVLAFAGWAALTLLYSSYRFATGLELLRLAGHVCLYCLVVVSVRSMGQVRRLIGAACLAAVPVCIYGFIQAAGRDPIQWEAAQGRVFSSLGNATYLASFLVLLIPIAVAAGWPDRGEPDDQSDRPRRRLLRALVSVLFFAAAAMLALCLYFTVTLSPTAGLLLGGLLALALAMLRDPRLLFRVRLPAILACLVLAVGLGVAGYRFLPDRQKRRVQTVLQLKDPSGPMRVLQWRSAWGLFTKSPVLGKGYGTFGVHSLERMAPSWYADLKQRPDKMLVPNYAHNELLGVLADTGIIGGALFLALLGTGFIVAARVVLGGRDAAWRRVALGIAAASTAFAVQNVFGVTFRQTGAVTFFWLWLGVLAVAGASQADPDGEVASPQVRELHFRPPGPFRLTSVALACGIVCVVIADFTIRPARAHMLIKKAEREAKLARYQTAAQSADNAIELWPYSHEAYYLSAYAWGQLEDYDKAQAANLRALDLLPGNASVHYNLGVTYKRMGRLAEAEESFKTAIELQPTSSVHQAAMAELLMQRGRLDDALPYAKAALELNRQDPRIRLLLADIEVRRGESAEAIAYLKKASRMSPGDVNIWRDLAQLSLREQQHKTAISAGREWIRLEPDSASAYALLGICYYDTGAFAKAERAFERALELDPGHLRSRLSLAYTYGRLRKVRQATQELERVVREGPNTKWGRAARQMLEKVRPPGRAR